MRTVNNWVSVSVNSQSASYSNLKFSILQDENGLYDLTAATKVGNADFVNQVFDLPTVDAAKDKADEIVFKAYGVSTFPLVIPKVTQDAKEAMAKRAAAVKKYSEASRTHAMLLMSRVNSIAPKLQDFLDDENYIWIPKDPSGRPINSPSPVPRPI